MRDFPAPSMAELLETITAARRIFGTEMNIQTPPNLVSNEMAHVLHAGINDWGGISPITPDRVNPEKPWPALDEIKRETEKAGYLLRERLPVYPEFLQKTQPLVNERLLAMADQDGYAKNDFSPC